MTTFKELNLIEPIQSAISEEGYDTPTPIQAQSIPHLLEGRDMLGIAQTGTGKTAAFTLPMLQRLAEIGGKPKAGHPRALILAPTRELANQIGDSLRTYGRHLPQRSTTIFGGVSMERQYRELSRNIDTVVATPGRLLDLINQKRVSLDKIEIFVLDEADRMLDMGFMPDVQKIVSGIQSDHQTLMFSATMPPAVETMARKLLTDPLRVDVAPQSTTAERVDHSVIFSARSEKNALLLHTLKGEGVGQVLVFTRTKYGADRVARQLRNGGIEADAIHGNKSQNARDRALAQFKKGKVQALVATDIAARGIDIDGVTHVINYEVPNDPENYVHRIGRTARAGNDGIALTFCDIDECAYLRSIEKVIRDQVPTDTDHPFHDPEIMEKRGSAKAPARKQRGGGGGGRPSGPKKGQKNAKSKSRLKGGNKGGNKGGKNTANQNNDRIRRPKRPKAA